MPAKYKLVYGWGVNDLDREVQKFVFVDGKHKVVWSCPYYNDWRHMLERCLNKNYQEKYPTYKGCTVCEEWKYLSNFIKWVDSQPNKDWQNCVLDKDLLSKEGRHYSPENCAYISGMLNGFLIDSKRRRGKSMIGACKNNGQVNYVAQCRNPLLVRQEYLGRFTTELEAHRAWQTKKHEIACILANRQEDERVAKALRERYAPDKDWTKK